MKSTWFLILNLAALLLAGCSSTPTKVNTGPITAATFSFVDAGTKPAPNSADRRQALHALIQESISRNLGGQGVSQVASGGDVTVAYLVIVGDKVSTEAISTYFGYGRDLPGLHDKAHDAYGRSKNPNAFKAGTLLVDIIDGKSYKLLKRSYVVRPVLSDATAEVQAARIQEAVDEVLMDVQIRH